jgi:uncharacterized protein
MLNPATAALILAAVLVLLGPLTSPLERRFFQSSPSTRRKLAYYALNMALSWGLAIAALAIYGWPAISDSAGWTGWLPFPQVGRPVLGALLAGYFVLGLAPFFQSLQSARKRRAYASAYRRHAAEFPALLPANAIERAAFILIALTAGICEEVLYRGFLIRFLHDGAPAQSLPALPLIAALLISSLAFGLGHLYQGRKGVLGTSVAGLGLGLLFLVTGSLIPAIIMHALVDLQAVYVLGPVPGDTIEAAAT